MSLRAATEKLIHVKNPSFAVRLFLMPLALCSCMYGAAMLLRAWLYKACLFESHGLPCRVISVGNMTVGGTGKTPTVCLLARRLKEKGFKVCVVSRGYRGAQTKSPLIVSDGSCVLAQAEDAGDETVMLARQLPGIPVIACHDRVAAGHIACERFGAQAILLDDGLQHLRLRRDLDIVLINAADPFGNGHLLPRGILREPLRGLGRAGIIVFTKADDPGHVRELIPPVKAFNPSAPIFIASYRITGFRKADGTLLSAGQLTSARIAALCSIGDPYSFLNMLGSIGIAAEEKLIFPDHHQYGQADYMTIQAASQRAGFIVTTEKDIAKLDSGMLHINNLIVMEIEQVIKPAVQFLQEVISRSELK